LHILILFCPEESVAVLVRHDDRVSVKPLNADLNRYPLIIRDEDHFGGRFMVVLTSEKMEPSSIAAHEVEHKDAIELNQVAVFDGVGGGHGRACSFIDH